MGKILHTSKRKSFSYLLSYFIFNAVAFAYLQIGIFAHLVYVQKMQSLIVEKLPLCFKNLS
jgi:hypothetical protein